MNKSSTDRLLPKIGQPLRHALTVIAPHFASIRETWIESMRNPALDIDLGDLNHLACLTLEANFVSLRSGRMSDYRLAITRCAHSLDRRGVPPVHALIALSLYLDSCCARLVGLTNQDTALIMALTRFNLASQSLVVVAYPKQHSTNALRLVENERRRFSQDLHDEIGHNLIVLKLYLELMARDYKRGTRDDISDKLEEAMALVSQSINSVRRVTLDLGPAVLDQLGLVPSFKVYADQFSARTGIKVEVRGKNILQMPKGYKTALFRVFQGALSNVAKHSKARSVHVTARRIKGPTFHMTIEDNGVGFVATGRRANRMFGLTAMQERIEALGGRFSLTSRPASAKYPRSGTKIDVALPMTELGSGVKA